MKNYRLKYLSTKATMHQSLKAKNPNTPEMARIYFKNNYQFLVLCRFKFESTKNESSTQLLDSSFCRWLFRLIFRYRTNHTTETESVRFSFWCKSFSFRFPSLFFAHAPSQNSYYHQSPQPNEKTTTTFTPIPHNWCNNFTGNPSTNLQLVDDGSKNKF